MKTIKLFALILALAFLWACGGGSSDSGIVPGPTHGPAGTATFISNGGAGGTGTGGYGGGISFDVYGDVWVTRSGSVNTSFTVPTYASNYGANKLTISSNTTAKLDPSPAIGDVYLKTGSQSVFYYDTSEHIATGLEVRPGATLTLPANYAPIIGYGGASTGSAQIAVDQTVTINGTVKTAEMVDISISAGKYSLLEIGRTGTVTTKPTTAGIDGGYIYLYSGAVAINRGTIDSSGSDVTMADGAAITKGTINPSGIAVDGGAGGGVNKIGRAHV